MYGRNRRLYPAPRCHLAGRRQIISPAGGSEFRTALRVGRRGGRASSGGGAGASGKDGRPRKSDGEKVAFHVVVLLIMGWGTATLNPVRGLDIARRSADVTPETA